MHVDPRSGPSLTVAPGQGWGLPCLLVVVATKIVAVVVVAAAAVVVGAVPVHAVLAVVDVGAVDVALLQSSLGVKMERSVIESSDLDLARYSRTPKCSMGAVGPMDWCLSRSFCESSRIHRRHFPLLPVEKRSTPLVKL